MGERRDGSAVVDELSHGVGPGKGGEVGGSGWKWGDMGLPKGNFGSYRVEIEPGRWGLESREVKGDAKETILKITPPKEMRGGDLEYF